MIENDAFDRSDWWDPGGFVYGLHDLLNPVRIPYIESAVADSQSILDIGCGGGYVAHAIRHSGRLVVGVDLSAAATRSAAIRGGAFVTGDAHALPFGDGFFDAVILSEVLEHVAVSGAVLAEAARVLRPGGVMVVTGPNRTFLSRLGLIWLAQEWPTRVLPRGLHQHRRFVRPVELEAMARNLQLSMIDLTGLGVPAARLTSAARALSRLRMGDIAYAEAARRVELARRRSTAIAYMAILRRSPCRSGALRRDEPVKRRSPLPPAGACR